MFYFIRHEVKFYFKNKAEAIYIYSYLLSMLVLVPFAVAPGATALQSLAPLALWIALASAVTMGSFTLFKRDTDHGRLEYYQLLPVSLESIVFAKWAAFFLFLICPYIVILPACSLLFGFSASHMVHYAIGLAASAAALSMLSTTVAAVMSGMEKAGMIVGLIVLPLAIPIIIFGTAYGADASHDWQPGLLFILGFSLFLLPIMCLAGASSIRASH